MLITRRRVHGALSLQYRRRRKIVALVVIDFTIAIMYYHFLIYLLLRTVNKCMVDRRFCIILLLNLGRTLIVFELFGTLG